MICFVIGLNLSVPGSALNAPAKLVGTDWAREPSYAPQAIDFHPIWNAPGGIITDLEVDPVYRNNIYVTNGYEIFKSVNGGQTWRKLNLDIPQPKALCAPWDNTLLFYSSSAGLMVSTDGGNSFGPVPGVPTDMKDAVFCVDTATNSLYLALGNGNSRIYVYHGTPDSWELRSSFNLSPPGGAPRSLWSRRDSLFMGIGGSGGLTESYSKLLVLRSLNGGQIWLPFWENDSSGNVEDIEIVRTNNWQYMFFITDRGIFYDYTITPNPTGHILLPAWSEMFILSASNDTVEALLARNGVLPGLFYTKIYRLSVFDTSLLYSGEGITDLGFTQNVGIAGTEGLGVLLSNNLLQNWRPSNDSLLAWTSMGIYSIWSNDTLVYSIDFSGHLYRSLDAGASWTLTSLNPLFYGIATAASPTQPEVVYAVTLYLDSTGADIVLRSTDAGNTWTGMGGFDTLDGAFPAYLRVDPGDYNRLWAVRFSTTNQTKASYSTNGGSDWTDISLPDTVRCLEVAPDSLVFWGTRSGVYWGNLSNSFSNRIDSLNGKNIVGLLYNPHDGRLYAADASSGKLWAGFPGDQASWTPITDIPNNIYAMKGVFDNWGDLAMLMVRYADNPIMISTFDYGNSWNTDTLARNIVCVGAVDSGRLIAGTVGNGMRRASIMPMGPLSVWVSANPTSPKLGDSCYVNVEVNRWIPNTPVCTLTTEGGDILPVTLMAADTTGRMFRGAFWTGGLHEGPGIITATAYDKFGNMGTGSVEIVIGPGVGEFMPGDSVYVYPNPAPTSDYGDYIYFRIFTSTEAEVDVLLYDLEGKPAGSVSGKHVTGGLSQAIALDISRISSGIYIWRLRASAVNGSQKGEKMGKLAIRK